MDLPSPAMFGHPHFPLAYPDPCGRPEPLLLFLPLANPALSPDIEQVGQLARRLRAFAATQKSPLPCAPVPRRYVQPQQQQRSCLGIGRSKAQTRRQVSSAVVPDEAPPTPRKQQTDAHLLGVLCAAAKLRPLHRRLALEAIIGQQVPLARGKHLLGSDSPVMHRGRPPSVVTSFPILRYSKAWLPTCSLLSSA